MVKSSKLLIIFLAFTVIGEFYSKSAPQPAYTVSSQAASNYASLKAAISVSETSGTINQFYQNSPKYSFNINFGKTAGYSFFGDAWGKGTQPGGVSMSHYHVAADLVAATNSFASANWSKGITFVMLAFDGNSNIITDLTKVGPSYFNMYMYDTSTGNSLCGPVTVPLDGASNSSNFTQPVPSAGSVWTDNHITAIGGVNNLNYESVKYSGPWVYPLAVTITRAN